MKLSDQMVFWQSLGKITRYFKPKSKAIRSPTYRSVVVKVPSPASTLVLDDSCSAIFSFDYDDDSTALSSDLDPG